MAIVGCSFRDKQRLNQLVKKYDWKFRMPVRFFSDPEVAKIWLVSEQSKN
jgi:hypothetical protein